MLGLDSRLAEAMVAGPGLRAVPVTAFGCAARPGAIRRRPEARAGAAGPWAVRPSRRLGRLRGAGGRREAGRVAECARECPDEVPLGAGPSDWEPRMPGGGTRAQP